MVFKTHFNTVQKVFKIVCHLNDKINNIKLPFIVIVFIKIVILLISFFMLVSLQYINFMRVHFAKK